MAELEDVLLSLLQDLERARQISNVEKRSVSQEYTGEALTDILAEARRTTRLLAELVGLKMAERRKTPGLPDIQEIYETDQIEEANERLDKGWILLNTRSLKETAWYVLGRPEGIEPQPP
jgi:hypothetical protein